MEQARETDHRQPPSLPEEVRARVVTLVAEVLPALATLPPSLRRIADFAPTRRARLGASQIVAELDRDDDFRRRVASQVQAQVPALADLADAPPGSADPVELAALLWLARPVDWDDGFADAESRIRERRELALAHRETEALARSERRAEEAERTLREARIAHRDALAALKAENATLRRKLGDARAAERTAREEIESARRDVEAAVARATEAESAADGEVRRLRRRLEEAESEVAARRRSSRTERDDTTLRARLLLDTLLEAGAGLRRELALPPVEGAPGDRVESGYAGSETSPLPTSGGGPAVLEQYLAMPRARLIVDGYNVSKEAWPTLSLEAQRLRLLGGLSALVARTGADTTVVFDAASSQTRGSGPSPRGVKVLFSPEDVIADDVIRELVAAEPSGRVMVVVTSDGALAESLTRAGARVVGAAHLIGALDR